MEETLGTGIGGSAAWEALALLKRQHREQARAWGDLLAAKERATAAALSRASRLEEELKGLRVRLREAETKGLEGLLEAHEQVKAFADKAESAAGGREAERRALSGLLDAARGRLAADTARFEEEKTLWSETRARLEAEVADLKEAALKAADDARRARESAERRDEALAEARRALEKTLAELLAERRSGDDRRGDAEAAEARLGETRRHYAELSRLWDEERKQWGQLAGVPAPPLPDAPEETARPPSEPAAFAVPAAVPPPSFPEAAPLEAPAVEPPLPSAPEPAPSTEAADSLVIPREPQPDAPPTAGRGLLTGLWEKVRAFFQRGRRLEADEAPRLSVLSLQPVALERPRGLAFDGRLLWAAEEGGRLVAFEPRLLEPVKAAAVRAEGARLAGLAFADGALWSLDEARGLLLRHGADDPAEVVSSSPAPGPEPRGLAFDGTSLWSWDGRDRAFHRHEADPARTRAYPGPGDLIVGAMTWADGRLWVYDAASARLLLLAREGEGFVAASSHDLGAAVVGLAPAPAARGERLLWALGLTGEGLSALARCRW